MKTYSDIASLVDPLDFAHPSSGVGYTAVEHFAELTNLCENSCSVEIRSQLECKVWATGQHKTFDQNQS